MDKELLVMRTAWAREQMELWGLGEEYKIHLFESVRTLGEATSQKLIRLNIHLLAKAPDAVYYDTVLHEIAHHKAGLAQGHNNIWKGWCVEVGASPEATCGDWSPDIQPKWETVCKTCGIITRRTHIRRSQKTLDTRICRKCNGRDFKQRRSKQAAGD